MLLNSVKDFLLHPPKKKIKLKNIYIFVIPCIGENMLVVPILCKIWWWSFLHWKLCVISKTKVISCPEEQWSLLSRSLGNIFAVFMSVYVLISVLWDRWSRAVQDKDQVYWGERHRWYGTDLLRGRVCTRYRWTAGPSKGTVFLPMLPSVLDSLYRFSNNNKKILYIELNWWQVLGK